MCLPISLLCTLPRFLLLSVCAQPSAVTHSVRASVALIHTCSQWQSGVTLFRWAISPWKCLLRTYIHARVSIAAVSLGVSVTFVTPPTAFPQKIGPVDSSRRCAPRVITVMVLAISVAGCTGSHRLRGRTSEGIVSVSSLYPVELYLLICRVCVSFRKLQRVRSYCACKCTLDE